MKKILIHYSEIALKGKNRRAFEQQLIRNIRKQFQPHAVVRKHGRILVSFEELEQAMLDHLCQIPGICHIAQIHIAELDIEHMYQVAKEVLAEQAPEAGTRFALRVKRGNKQFPHTSPALGYEIGGRLKADFDLQVDLSNPTLSLHLEISDDEAYVFSKKLLGVGGLPVGSSGHGMVLLSGGIDSPVAAYMMMKRGMRVSLLHCFNSSINRDFSKIKKLAQQLSRFQPNLRLYMLDLEGFQRHAIANVPDKLRMVIYKRHMLRTAVTVAEKVNAQALVTGDSLGQVASQTLTNIQAIYDVSPLPILSPLIALDKLEIIDIGRRIGTYDISIEEYCDICSWLIAKHPETHAKKAEVAHFEKILPLDIESPMTTEIYSV
ncbi:MAG: tRNA uracil 4-sulfurtransferase ThiI [Mariprofundaceae bacterium]|nr:tRNA uracil 4-sulfurtransferase ThiI [Mariprofundaceae bacterium]